MSSDDRDAALSRSLISLVLKSPPFPSRIMLAPRLDSATSLFGAPNRRSVPLLELLESGSLGSESAPPDLRERGRRHMLGKSSSPQHFPSRSTLPLPLLQHLHTPTPRPVSNLRRVRH